MKQYYKPILINTAATICGLFALYGIAVDVPLIAEAKRMGYIEGRIVFAIFCSYILVEVNLLKRQYELQVPVLYFGIMLYCMHGQLYLPCYYLPFMEVVAGFSLFFPMPKRYYYFNTIAGTILMTAIIFKTQAAYTTDVAQNLKFKVDAALGVVLINIIAYIGYKNITLVRQKQHFLSQKFLELGRNFGDLIHNLKGQCSSPLVYAEVLRRELSKEDINREKVLEIIKNLTEDLSLVEKQVNSINYLSKNDNKSELVNVKLIFNNVIDTFFKNKTDSIKITYLGEETIMLNEYFLRTAFINLIKNSIENFEINGTKDRKISLIVSDSHLLFSDNGGGFSRKFLQKFRQSDFYTEKENGSGLGMFLVKEYLESLNWQLSIFNDKDSANVKMKHSRTK